MEKIKINLGATWDVEQLIKINELNALHENAVVTEVYGSIGSYPTARSFDRLPAWDNKRFGAYMETALRLGISVKWTMNQSCLGNLESLDEIMYKTIVDHMVAYGQHKYIVAVPLMLQIIKENDADAEIEVSTISRVTTLCELESWLLYGANAICWDVMENRNIPLLKQAAKLCHTYGATLEVIANEFCLYGCIHRNTCYNLSSHNSGRKRFGGYPFSDCISDRVADPVEWVKARFILPSWTRQYMDFGVDKFKITGRTHPTQDVLRVLSYYMDEKDPEDLLSLWHHIEKLVDGTEQHPVIYTEVLKRESMLDHFIQKGSACRSMPCKNGNGCTYCQSLYELAEGE